LATGVAVMNDGAGRCPGKWRWRSRSIVVVTFVIVAIAPFASSASAKAQTLKPGDKYVALGSSFASGPMIPDVADKSCLRSTNNYPHLVAAKLKLSLTDVSCGAATTDHIISTPQGGVHPKQIDAVTPDTKLVTVTIGGNDIDYTVANLVCASDGAKGQSCLTADVNQAANAQKLAALPAKMAATLQAIKQAAPKARVIVLPYLRVMPDSATPCPPSVPMGSAELRYLVGYGEKLHAVLKRSAAAAKVDFVDSYTPKGHDACATPSRRWVEGEVPASPAFPFHPNGAGMKAQAKMILERLKS
jgi:lysophospholipase L1-like esterase